MTSSAGQQTAPDSVAWYQHFRGLVVARLHELLDPYQHGVYLLCRYHLGWADEHGAPAEADSGKLLRPVLCLAACNGYGDAGDAVGVAAALELLHAFSLAHDDIEDGDRERRHRPTLWDRFGVPLALNAGDALFAQALTALHAGVAALNRERAAFALRLFTAASLHMIEGQHADIEFEARPSVSAAEYVEMARGKTGAIIGASLALGALCGGADLSQVQLLEQAGVELGLAFQATDDALGFWGDPAQTGKAVGNDLLRGKKSLPVVLAVERGLQIDTLRQQPLAGVQAALEQAGCRDGVEQFALRHAAEARRRLAAAKMAPEAQAQLGGLIDFAVSRVS